MQDGRDVSEVREGVTPPEGPRETAWPLIALSIGIGAVGVIGLIVELLRLIEWVSG